ncbi:hypothetical protein GCM10010156_04550 [Planobispora rosea]|uniref:CU044_5270 family protein n=1 Tax=Planobispora rosea TaxID=35762 RepID=A0A8J3S299_PLARO|nr:CU044_5270 family protein [Planobispora rosea]GGS48982.1 hypothetical protein GCM10010156_04550 [Planobispora rosea]GIH83739.1 hypothetical protein Pro02_21470 [Planobispora rosea]
MKSDITALRELLGPHDPAAAVRGDPAVRRTTLSTVFAAFPAPDHTPPIHLTAVPATRGGSRAPALARRMLISGLATAAAATAVAVLSTLDRTATAHAATPPPLAYSGTGTRSAHEALLEIADRAARLPDDTGTGRYLYTRTRGWHLGSVVNGRSVRSAVVPVLTERWTAQDRPGRIRTVTSHPEFPSEESRAAWEAEGRPGLEPQVSDETLDLPPRWRPGDLVPDAERLSAALGWAGPPESGAAELLVTIADLYREQPVRPAVRAGVLRLLSGLADLRYEGTVVDRAGRPGVAVSLESDHGGLPNRHILIFDGRTGELLGEERTLTATAGELDLPVPSIISYTLFLDAGKSISPTPR